MFKFISALIIAQSVLQVSHSVKTEGKIWAFLAATSNGWINYRHQADLCHAYHLLRDNGIAAENIVTMFYDDIANNDMNKDKGVIVNRPGGPNVYQGVAKDYTGQDVSVENFFNVLSGNKDAMRGKGTGRVIESGPNDHVFVYVVDHGDTGLLLFPNGEYLYASNMTQQLREMKKNNHFKKMLMYIEACKAGSMFDNIIDDDLHVFVSTASAPDEFSWARYCDTIDTCLGDYYSTTWMEHMDGIRENWSAKYTTLFKQFKNTRTNVNKSHVNIYGDFRLGFDKISNFLGDNWTAKKSNSNRQPHKSNLDNSVVPANELEVYYLKSKIQKATDKETKQVLEQELNSLLTKRETIDKVIDMVIQKISQENNKIYNNIVQNSKPSLKEEHFPCYQDMIENFNNHCFDTYKNSYVTRHFYKLANLCVIGHTGEELKAALKISCNDNHRLLENVV